MTSMVLKVGEVTKHSDLYDGISPRVNSALLPKFVTKRVRVPGKILSIDSTSGGLRLQTSDAGVIFVTGCDEDLAKMEGLVFVEIVGTVTEEQVVNYYCHADMGASLDLTLVDKVIHMIHDPRYFQRFFDCRRQN